MTARLVLIDFFRPERCRWQSAARSRQPEFRRGAVLGSTPGPYCEQPTSSVRSSSEMTAAPAM